MQTTRVITGVRVILGIEKPVIVFKLDGFADVVRNPKQALTDLQNSGRITDVRSTNDPRFAEELHKCVGAQLTGDLKAFKAGDTYKVSEGHPEVLAGTAKIGESRIAEKDGVWVEGFLSIPKTLMQQQLEANANAYATVMTQMFGFAGGTPAIASTPVSNGFTPEDEDEDEPETELIKKAKGEKAKA